MRPSCLGFVGNSGIVQELATSLRKPDHAASVAHVTCMQLPRLLALFRSSGGLSLASGLQGFRVDG